MFLLKTFKLNFRKQNLIFLILFLLLSISISAQVPDDIDNTGYSRDYIFEHLDLSEVPSGLLYDYGLPIAPLESFTGQAPNENHVMKEPTFRLLYATLFSAATNPGVMLPDPLINLGPVIEENTIPFKMLFYRYDTFREDALTEGLISITDNQLYNVSGASESPYESQEVFAAMPWTKKELILGTYSFTQDMITNLESEVQKIWIDFGDGNGSQSWETGVTLQIDYNTVGTKDITLRVRLSDGFTRTCRSQLSVVEPEESVFDRYDLEDIFTLEVPGGGGTVSVLPFCEGTEEIHKPLILINGIELPGLNNWNLGDIIERLKDFNESPTDNLVFDDIENAGYDIIFIDWDLGVANLHENGDFVRRTIHAINARKAESGSTEKNVVVGMSMGGVCGKLALREMEVAGENHESKVFFSFDSPLRGANFPLGAQHALDHVANIHLVGGFQLKHFIPEMHEVLSGLEATAPKQLLVYHKDLDPNDPDGPYRSFFSYFKDLGPIQDCEHIAISNGSQVREESGAPYDNLVTLDAGIPEVLSLLGWSDFWASFVGSLGNTITGLRAKVDIWRLPDGTVGGPSKAIYKGSYKSFLFSIIPILYSYKKELNPPGCLALDSAPGGLFPVSGYEIPNSPGINIFSNRICFIPTVSAIGVGPFQSQFGSLSDPLEIIDDNETIFNDGLTDVSRIIAVDDAFPIIPEKGENQWHVTFSYDNSGLFLMEILDGQGLTGTNTLNSTFNFGIGDIEFDYFTAIIGTIGLPVKNSGHLINHNLTVGASGQMWIAHGDRIAFVSNTANPENIAEEFQVILGSEACTEDPVTLYVNNGGVVDIGEWDETAGVTNKGILATTDNSTLAIGSSGTVTVNHQSGLDIRDGSVAVVRNGGVLQALHGGTITVRSGAELYIQTGGLLYLHSSSQLIIEEGAKLTIESGASIQLWDGTDVYGDAVIDVFGELEVQGEFKFSGNGYFKFEPGNTLTLTGDEAFYLSQESGVTPTRFIEIVDDAKLDINGGKISLRNGIVQYGNNTVLKGGQDAQFNFSEIQFEGSEDAIAVFATGGATQLTTNKCIFDGFDTAIEAYEIFTPLFIIDKTVFTNNNIGLLVENMANIRVNTSTFQGGIPQGQAMVLKNIATFRLTESIVENYVLPNDEVLDAWGAIELHDEVPEFVMSGGYIRNNGGAGIYCPAGYKSNVFLRNQATISDNDIGIHIVQGATVSGGLDYGLVLMDCANLLNNTIGIKGQDVLLQIDSYDNLGDNDITYLRPNHFQNPDLGNLFEICYDVRDEAGVSARGNYWGTDNANIETASQTSYHLLQNSNVGNGCVGYYPNIPLDVSDKVSSEPTGCPEAPSTPGGDPEPGFENACVIAVGTPNEIVAHEEYSLAYRAFDEKLATEEETGDIKHMFAEMSAVDDTERDQASEPCKQYIDVSRVMISAESMKYQITGNNSNYSQSISTTTYDTQNQLTSRQSTDNGIELSPNPAQDYFLISVPTTEESYQVEIFDNLGRKVVTTHTRESIEIGTSSWVKGLYHVLMTDEVSGQTTSLKVIVQ